MLEWMIAIGALCGTVGVFGATVIGLDLVLQVRTVGRRCRLPRARLHRARQAPEPRRKPLRSGR